ncbi:related to glucuronyl hydrolase [Cephalotrichum gorgonifer]|uniref:Related to glucuronyl hydrolase n=1 Tax=Cephalotrichum gorgonifer TaxID=2041049 RepID=A0AAE8SSW8_9PEZI|nr:related to glucuronyl hydrolase [Cephalotrichum gorgonifer]
MIETLIPTPMPTSTATATTAMTTTTTLETLKALNGNPPCAYPELVPQDGETQGSYSLRVIDFWTCGFFPGSIWGLVERATRHPQSMKHDDSRLLLQHVRRRLEDLGRTWSDPIAASAHRTDTHDLGFIILPHMRPRWELFHDQKALDSICTAAASLYSRFDARVGAIRPWDTITWMRDAYFLCKETNFLVIIDSMCNLELLYYAAAHTGHNHLASAATTHAKTLINTVHVANFAPTTSDIQQIYTAQGHLPSTTWSRGQAWAILGYAQAFQWTGDEDFLGAARGAAEYFLLRLETAPACVEVLSSQINGHVNGLGGTRSLTGRYVRLWDFDAPIEEPQSPLRDASAGVAAANGLLVLAQILMKRGQHLQADGYLQNAVLIVEDMLALSLSKEECRLETRPNGGVSAVGKNSVPVPFESIIRNSTVTWNEHSRSRNGDHGLVYADYYLIEFGNRLLQLGYHL